MPKNREQSFEINSFRIIYGTCHPVATEFIFPVFWRVWHFQRKLSYVFCSKNYHAGLNTDKRLFCIVVAYAHMELLANEQSPLVPSQLHGCIENSEKMCSSAFYFEPTLCISKNIKNIAITTHLKRYQGRFCHYDWDFYRPRNFSERSRNLSRGCFLGKARHHSRGCFLGKARSAHVVRS